MQQLFYLKPLRCNKFDIFIIFLLKQHQAKNTVQQQKQKQGAAIVRWNPEEYFQKIRIFLLKINIQYQTKDQILCYFGTVVILLKIKSVQKQKQKFIKLISKRVNSSDLKLSILII
eukprot:TRINITY_DN20674_c0_g1_i3.p2 TRINITY_DN20674_c0_g1~~TRINITY_DN20674_c0_g1_i3.p2  ORF type:complete len:116 (+),score=0.15 TRINITY_DN20674_c0_g1_i3:203-550(+)